ncbi:hypothetical protein AXF42_Ash014902 [Apostasia shenzhenica]|uniref:DUF4378 domain-containing protein n=1 Tax=Apostasia shenzhenica TaxID=1088818 RepID=A0A2I0ALG2_9ASPA|nr:hypothetical protein AXF42_Ash014902 [Apostasia shenzhenica]
MAEILRCDSSKLFDSHHSGCIWGLFRLFDFYQQRGSMKMLSIGHGNGRNGGGTKIVMANEEVGDADDIAAERASLLVDDKAKVNKSSRKARILSLVSKKLQRRRKHKGKVSPSSSPQMHTIAIHHLESNDCVFSGELGQTSSDSETSKMEHHENSSTMSEQQSKVSIGPPNSVNGRQGACEAIDVADELSNRSQKFDELQNRLLDEHMILKQKVNEARETLLRKKDADPLGMTKDFSLHSKGLLDTLNLFNANKEALLNIRKDLKYQSSVSLQLTKGSATNSMLRHKQLVVDSFISQERKTVSECQLIDNAGNSSNCEVLPSSNELRKQRGDRTVMNLLRDLKQKIKDVIDDNGKERHRISKDRILHKVPIGQKIQEVEDGKLYQSSGPTLERYGAGYQYLKFDSGELGPSNGKFVQKSIRRSRSLTEFLDRYSLLLESTSVNEHRKSPGRSKSTREDRTQQQVNLTHTLGRMMSNPGFRSYSLSKYGQSELNSAFQLGENPTSDPLDSNIAISTDCSDELDIHTVKVTSVEETTSERKEAAEHHTAKNEEIGVGSCNLVATTMGKCFLETIRHQEHAIPENELNQNYPFEFLGTLEEENALLKEYDIQIQDEAKVKPEKTSPISVLESNFEGEPLGPVNYLVTQDTELQPFCISLEDQNSPCKGQNHAENATDSFLIHVDEEHAALYRYVRHILSKTGYGLLLEETNFLPDEVDSGSIHSGMTSEEQQLLHDLIKELLLQIYENSTISTPRLSRMNPQIRSLPTGNYLLEELWTRIRWHICSPLGLSTSINDLMARDFAKADRWMNLYRDAECCGLLLEDMILDDLADEIILDSPCCC